MSKKTITKNVSDVIKVSQEIGDQVSDIWTETKDFKAAQTALAAYKTAIAAAKAQLIYKKLTGKPGTIKFLEDK
jgi:hypothetical protein